MQMDEIINDDVYQYMEGSKFSFLLNEPSANIDELIYTSRVIVTIENVASFLTTALVSHYAHAEPSHLTIDSAQSMLDEYTNDEDPSDILNYCYHHGCSVNIVCVSGEFV